MKKILLIGIVFLLSLFSVFASNNEYYPNQTIRFEAQYTENGVLTDSNASIIIFFPNNAIDINTNMTIISTGKFYYDYNIPEILGTYKLEITFFNSIETLGIVTEYFNVVEIKSSEKNFDSLILAQIFIILFFVGAGLLFKAKMYTRILAFGLAIIQFLILVFINLGIYIGTDLTTLLRANSYIFLIIGFGVGILSLLQHMKAIYLEEEEKQIKKKWQ